jgi:hypothetical protein
MLRDLSDASPHRIAGCRASVPIRSAYPRHRFRLLDDFALDPAPPCGDLCAAMARPPKILLPTLPAPARRIAGFWLLTLSLWLASAVALFR